jgi:glutathione S-transferase
MIPTRIPTLLFAFDPFKFLGRSRRPRRCALQDYEDRRISFSEFGALRFAGAFPFKSLPVLDVAGERFAQSCAILRYVGKLARLYPEDPVIALRVDMALEAIEEL